jgi:large subunit ribosomal protein L10
MALSKDRKAEVVAGISQLLDSSKLTVVAKYSGTSVKSMQQLRREARDSQTTVTVAKNRLVKKALADNGKFKELDTEFLSGQLMYAFNSVDEVAPAQVIAKFAKTEPQIEFIGAINSDGQLLSSDDVKLLAALPSKEQLRAQLVGTIAAPLSSFVNIMSGNVRSVLNVLSARADQIS